MDTDIIKEEQAKLESVYENIRQTTLMHDDLNMAFDRNNKHLMDILENKELSEEDRIFFEEQLEMVKKLRKKEGDDFEYYSGNLKKQRDSIEDKIEDIKKENIKSKGEES